MFGLYDVPSAASNFSKIPPTPNSAHGVFARADDITGIVPVYDCCFNTGILDSGWPVSARADRVTSGGSGGLFIV